MEVAEIIKAHETALTEKRAQQQQLIAAVNKLEAECLRHEGAILALREMLPPAEGAQAQA